MRSSLLPSPVALPLLSDDPGFPPGAAAPEDPGFSSRRASLPASVAAKSGVAAVTVLAAGSPLGGTSAAEFGVSLASSDASLFFPPPVWMWSLTVSLSSLIGGSGSGSSVDTGTYEGWGVKRFPREKQAVKIRPGTEGGDREGGGAGGGCW